MRVALVTSFALAGPAMAQTADPDDDDQIVLNGRLLVPSGETAGTAVLFNGTATIDGTVEETLVVFNGDVVVNGTVAEDVIVFNGEVRIASGAEVGGDLVSQATPVVEEGATVRGQQQQITGNIDVTDVGFASRIAWWIAYTVSALVLGLILCCSRPGSTSASPTPLATAWAPPSGSARWPSSPCPIVAVLLLVTVVGIPLGIFLMLAFA